MAHLTSEEYLYKSNIEEYLNVLAEKIIESGIGKHAILIVGGAAMALKHQSERSTVDIDICFREQNNLYACCQTVAKGNNLPDDWMNADVMHSDSFSYALFDSAKLFKTYHNVLDVFLVDDLDLYCMKLVSFRPKDIQDMEVLSASLKRDGISKDNVIRNFIRLYGDEYLLRNDTRKIRLLEAQLL
jgi:hypothetical protein